MDAVIALFGAIVGWGLGLATVRWQLSRSRNEAASSKVTEALAPVNDLLFDYAIMGGSTPVDLSTSRVPESELRHKFRTVAGDQAHGYRPRWGILMQRSGELLASLVEQ